MKRSFLNRLQILSETMSKTISDDGKDGYDAAEDSSARCLQIINAVIDSPVFVIAGVHELYYIDSICISQYILSAYFEIISILSLFH